MADVKNTGAIASHGGTVNVGGNAVGTMNQYGPSRGHAGTPGHRRADIGILTVLTEELDAVVKRLEQHHGYESVQLPGGIQAHVADIPADGGGWLRAAVIQTLDPGPRSATMAFERMQKTFRPPVVLLVGIAGGIRDDLSIGDVVIADQVVYYDARRETAEGPRRRGQSQAMTATLRHRLHEFFRRYGDMVPLDSGDSVRVWRGPIGSGDAVVTDRESNIIDFLRRFNEKTLAVETEAAGVGQAFYEHMDEDRALQGWLTIRGISDLADKHKRHDRHRFAAQRAAAVVERLLPLLQIGETR
jgi:adenosylhomocysteine nucleosidase